MSQPPPPPPPHGENPRTTAGGSIPPGKYDVFIIPEHSAGAGFLYLPSLRPQWNSFIAGVVSTLAIVIMANLASPIVVALLSSPERSWLLLLVTLVACVGAAAFLLGRHQNEPSTGQNREGDRSGGYQKPNGGYGGAGSSWYTPPPQNGAPPNQAPPPPPPPPQQETPRDDRGQYQNWQEQPRQQPQPEPQARAPPQPEPQPTPQPEPQRTPQPEPQRAPQPEPQPTPQPKPQPKPQQQRREEPREQPREQPKQQAKPQPRPQPQPQQQPKPSPPPQPSTPSTPSTPKTENPKGAWEKAREEMRRREDERKAKEAEAKKKEDTARRLRELREREARERERREKEAREREVKEKLRQEQEVKERERLEKEVREKVEKELREKVEKEAKERAVRDREAREREARLREEARKRDEARAQAEKERQAAREREREAREVREAKERKDREERAAKLRKEQEDKEKEARKGTTYAYSSVGEKTSMWPNGKPPSVAPSHAASTPPTPKPASPAPPSPTKPSPSKPAPSPSRPPPRSTAGTEDTYSYRPYDQPKKPTPRKKSVSDFSESSWAPSQSTARTTPPPSSRGPYTTSDPQKIVLRAVYGYLNQFSKTPASQLISGVSPVTDGLILRITSAGLFVDDDVRGVAQREWDVKAWTIKGVEVWCPVHAANAAASSPPGTVPTNHPFFKTMPASARSKAERGATKTFLGEEAVQYIDEFGATCKGNCHVGAGSASGSSAAGDEWKGKGLHLLRATIRDQEGKRYLFVVGEDEAWKIAPGLAALRGSSQVRGLGVAGFSAMESRSLLDTLGWGS